MIGFYKKIVRVLILTIIMSMALFTVVFWGIKDVYRNNYQKGYMYQYRALQNAPIDEKKIIIIGGSYMTFAVNSIELSEKLGTPVYTLGIHSGMGMEYILETAKKFANEGDTILFSFIPYEVDQYGMDLIFISLDGETDVFGDFVKKHPIEVLKSIGAATVTKLYSVKDYVKKRNLDATSVYDARSFDSNTGCMIYDRPKCATDKERLMQFKGICKVEDIEPECIQEVIDLSDYCDSNNIHFELMNGPYYYGYYDDASRAKLLEYQHGLESLVNRKMIVDITECGMPLDYIYDEILHANNQGMTYYTDLIYNALVDR